MDSTSTNPYEDTGGGAPHLLVQVFVVALVMAYLPSYWSFEELAAHGGCKRWFQEWDGWRVIAGWLFGEAKVVVEAKESLQTCDQGILAVAPHGVVSFNHALFMTDCAGWFRDGVWPVDRRDLAASFTFKVPFYREFLLWLGNVDASGNVARKVVASGRSLFVYPGGEAEQLRSAPGKHLAYWKSRKGFVRLAVEAGIPLIPSYAFGENELYAPLPIATGLRFWVAKQFRVAVPCCWGRWWCPFLPRKVPLVAVVGPPLPVPQVDKTNTKKFDETVDEVHLKFCNALVALFDRHKAAYATDGANATLTII